MAEALAPEILQLQPRKRRLSVDLLCVAGEGSDSPVDWGQSRTAAQFWATWKLDCSSRTVDPEPRCCAFGTATLNCYSVLGCCSLPVVQQLELSQPSLSCCWWS